MSENIAPEIDENIKAAVNPENDKIVLDLRGDAEELQRIFDIEDGLHEIFEDLDVEGLEELRSRYFDDSEHEEEFDDEEDDYAEEAMGDYHHALGMICDFGSATIENDLQHLGFVCEQFTVQGDNVDEWDKVTPQRKTLAQLQVTIAPFVENVDELLALVADFSEIQEKYIRGTVVIIDKSAYVGHSQYATHDQRAKAVPMEVVMDELYGAMSTLMVVSKNIDDVMMHLGMEPYMNSNTARCENCDCGKQSAANNTGADIKPGDGVIYGPLIDLDADNHED